ncbi:cupin domain-containing protein [Leptospira levettii]|uniref:cupin domain-containing protein n=1 Tax=Leptospira levettii TaxID=2023178 RepID=UPI001083CF16|nr:cupin domain-containing protein [Leptospira levettii]MCW7508557.1 cupin domain-containing protein [Leptospira levettii]MCW7519647.1 cupin domain-containing protein [Leptospira levettii]TGK98057.1 cupin domain-containing protein [Leptospira levettii]
MATIVRKNETIQDKDQVKAFLTQKGLVYESYKTPESLDLILGQKGLSDAEKEEILSGLEYRFDQLKKEHGYKANDLVVLHDEVPGINDVLAKFDKLHIHTDEEVRYIIDGSGIFGFIIDGERFEVHVGKGDFISIPANTNHWFTLDKNLRIKAVRYFKDNSGWTPVYVDESKVLINA